MSKIYSIFIILMIITLFCGCSGKTEKQYPKPVIVMPNEETHYSINGYKEKADDIVSSETHSDDISVLKTAYIGNKSSKKYHLPDCIYAADMKEENKRLFDEATDPEDFGFIKCKQCLKDK